MRQWGQLQIYVFGGEQDETRDHLCFACPYSFTAWSALAGKLLHHRLNPCWEETLVGIKVSRGDKIKGLLLRLCFQVAVYSLWRERNVRIHASDYNSCSRLIKKMEKVVWNKITVLNYTTKPAIRLLMQRWIIVRP